MAPVCLPLKIRGRQVPGCATARVSSATVCLAPCGKAWQPPLPPYTLQIRCSLFDAGKQLVCGQGALLVTCCVCLVSFRGLLPCLYQKVCNCVGMCDWVCLADFATSRWARCFMRMYVLLLSIVSAFGLCLVAEKVALLQAPGRVLEVWLAGYLSLRG